MCVVIATFQSWNRLQGFEFEQMGFYFYNRMSSGNDLNVFFFSSGFCVFDLIISLIGFVFRLCFICPAIYHSPPSYYFPRYKGYWPNTPVFLTICSYLQVGGLKIPIFLQPSPIPNKLGRGISPRPKHPPANIFSTTDPVGVTPVFLPPTHLRSGFRTMNDEVIPKQQELGAQGEAYDVALYHNDQGYYVPWMRYSNGTQGQASDPSMNIPATNAEACLSLYSFALNLQPGLPPVSSYPSEISEGDRAALSNMRLQMAGVSETPTGISSRTLSDIAFASNSVAQGYFGSPIYANDAHGGLDMRTDAPVAAMDPLYQEYAADMLPNAFGVDNPSKDYSTVEKENFNNRGYNGISNHPGTNGFRGENHHHHHMLRNSDPGLGHSIISDLRSSVDSGVRSSIDSGMRSSVSSTGRASVLSMPLAPTSSVPTLRDYALTLASSNLTVRGYHMTQWAHAQEQVSYMTPKEWESVPQAQPTMSLPVRPPLWMQGNTTRSAPEVMMGSNTWDQPPLAQSDAVQDAYSSDSPQACKGSSSPPHTRASQENCCPDHSCQCHHEGFKFRWLLRRHICNEHLKAYNGGRVDNYEDKELLGRFLSLVYVCHFGGCSRAFYRLDSLLRHQRLIHAQIKEEVRRNKVRVSVCDDDIFE